MGIVSNDLRHFEDAPPGEVDAIEAYCLAFRREDFATRGPFDERFRFYRNLDIWWSLVLRDEGEGTAPRRAVALADLPLTRHEHRGYTSLAPDERDRQSKRNFYRIIDRFGSRRDLLVGNGDAAGCDPLYRCLLRVSSSLLALFSPRAAITPKIPYLSGGRAISVRGILTSHSLTFPVLTTAPSDPAAAGRPAPDRASRIYNVRPGAFTFGDTLVVGARACGSCTSSRARRRGTRTARVSPREPDHLASRHDQSTAQGTPPDLRLTIAASDPPGRAAGY